LKEFRLLVWGISFIIAVVATALISLTGEFQSPSLLKIFLVILGASLFLLFFILKHLVGRDLQKIERLIKQMDGESVFDQSESYTYHFKKSRDLDTALREISERKSNEISELKKMADFRKDFIANISHELKTPIFAAQGFVHTLLDGAVKDKNVRTRFLKKAAKSLDGLDMLVQDLLTLSQIESGDIKMHREYFDILKLIEEVFDQLVERAGKRNITLNMEPRKGSFLVYADYRRIHQVIVNLVQNGMKYNKEGGIVKVTVDGYDDRISVSVSDNGKGIEPKHHKRIFERFYRVEKSRTRSKGGTGLGLAIVKHILEGHDTEIRVSSKLGEGSDFSFNLPTEKG